MKFSKTLSNCVFMLFIWLSILFPASPLSNAQDYTVTISTVSGCIGKLVERGQYRVGEHVQVKVLMTNISTKTLNVPKGDDYYRPQLFRDGQLVAYRKEVSERIEKLGKGTGARITGFLFLEPHEPQVDTIDLNYWYERLDVGQYQLSLQRIFFKQRVESNAVFFEVIR